MSQTQKTFFFLIIAFSIILLCSLGTWQMERLKWKESLIKQIESGQRYSLNVNALAMAGVDPKVEYQFKRGVASGVIVNNSAHYLIPRMKNGAMGGELVQLMRLLPSNKFLIINRGWVADSVDFTSFKGVAIANNVKGFLRDLPKKGFFQPDNPDQGNEIYWIDPIQLRAGFSINEDDVLPFVFYQTNTTLKAVAPHPAKIELRNKHFYYACFWFAMALVLFLFSAYFYYKYNMSLLGKKGMSK